MDEQEAILEVLAGRTSAFGLLVRKYHRPLYYFVVGKVTEDAEAEDIVQKTFVTAYQRLREFDRTKSLVFWLRGIALNHCRNEWKRVERQGQLENRVLEVKRAQLELGSLEESATQETGRIEALRKCIEALGPSDQNVVRLRFVEELPLKAIGAALNKTAEAARLLLFRIRIRLLGCVKKRLALEEVSS